MKRKLALTVLSMGMIFYAHAQEYTMDNCVNTLDTTRSVETKSGYQYWFADKSFAEGNTLKLSVVEPGMSTHAPHQHSEDEFFYVLEGTAEFFLDGETRIVGSHTSLYCPSQSMHGIKNAGTGLLKYLVIKKYELE
ncbi:MULTISPECIES: cupin domain-containing protein [Reichenbachiella]|uniref:cupin domain-containing protein n=1 Tax=Reichenbachiella TaxID=156993 RepID=UPI000E6BEB2D|nr:MULTISPECIES: cupin domain-containing protein [Reichenbachiella]MBU2912380.1 cupin domain-containing protein [Reichenbachiella agariperforans]RJE73192.1 cupin [Reichenbachiella sp. MSK19-1]